MGRVGDDERGRAAAGAARGRRGRALAVDPGGRRAPASSWSGPASARWRRMPERQRRTQDADLADALIASAAHLHVAGYALLRPGSRPAARAAASRALRGDDGLGRPVVRGPAVRRSSSTTPRRRACSFRTPTRRRCSPASATRSGRARAGRTLRRGGRHARPGGRALDRRRDGSARGRAARGGRRGQHRRRGRLRRGPAGRAPGGAAPAEALAAGAKLAAEAVARAGGRP